MAETIEALRVAWCEMSLIVMVVCWGISMIVRAWRGEKEIEVE